MILMPTDKQKIGLALGSGSARGWGHIGVIKALQEQHGIRPDIICGCSIGALVGAALACRHMDQLEQWVRDISMRDIVRLLDFNLGAGGLIQGERLLESFCRYVDNVPIEQLPVPFGAIATDLESGRECWLQQGSLHDAVRASIALPGLFSPHHLRHQWLVDGGLVNPVPVSLCRAMGADIVIAVNLNSELVGNHARAEGRETRLALALPQNELLQKIATGLTPLAKRAKAMLTNGDDDIRIPGMFEAMTGAIDIMQDRITRSRLAGDPPDVLISPRLGHMGLLEFDRGEEAIEEGYAAVASAVANGAFRAVNMEVT
ncbi:patatin-like phospholipase RssA [Mariprofundus ferrooxydans]|uniref:Patatin n=1 Tax=Mariprofundus ferrooxydans PV-1 TaxID=314345 RepID=Q0F3F5_9PROT|nr:Patatin [Mariprofundus ferrooxydans PV-1]KON48258.1 patatin [Mariprofundus ferrooxydans]